MNNSFKLLPFSKDRLKDLHYLFNLVHGKKYSVIRLNKKYDTTWHDYDIIGSFAYDSFTGEPVGFYGGFPICFTNQKLEKKIFFQAIDLVTHPRYRNQGLFILNALHTEEQAKELGIELFFSFPNKNSYHGFFNKLELIKTGSWSMFTLDIIGFKIYGLCHKSACLTKLFNLHWNRILKKYQLNETDWKILEELFIERLGENYSIHATVPYLKYKEIYSRARWIKYNDTFLFIKKDNGLNIGDLLIKKNTNDLESLIIELGKKLKVNRIVITSSPNHPLSSLLSKMKHFHKTNGSDIGVKFCLPVSKTYNVDFTLSDSDDF
jgi:GNAT superfamily N-acetyltransferase